jgi:hypothetical protein
VPDHRTHLATSVAALFLAACAEKPAPTPSGAAGSGTASTPAAAPTESVQCLGIHACKGQSACHVLGPGGHACAGQNACKGKGWISVPRAECTRQGGKVLES